MLRAFWRILSQRNDEHVFMHHSKHRDAESKNLITIFRLIAAGSRVFSCRSRFILTHRSWISCRSRIFTSGAAVLFCAQIQKKRPSSIRGITHFSGQKSIRVRGRHALENQAFIPMYLLNPRLLPISRAEFCGFDALNAPGKKCLFTTWGDLV